MLVTLNEVLLKAKKEKYAVGLFNTINTEMLQAAIEAAEECRSPIIIGTAEVLLPYGELKLIAPSVIEMAKRASVSVVVHYDHGLTFERCIEAMKLGFSSIMYDCSALSARQNTEAVREMVKIAHGFGVSVEGEIGHIGGTEGADADSDEKYQYTEVSEARDFAKNTGVDALAVAIGTLHGAYKSKPVLNFERLSEIHNAVNVPLVLHGGSGLGDKDFKETIKCGIAKINIFTDLCTAALNAPQKDNYLDYRNSQKDNIKQAVVNKIKLFGSGGKA